MDESRKLKNASAFLSLLPSLVLSSLFILVCICFNKVEAGTSLSTPKNHLVNLYTHSPQDANPSNNNSNQNSSTALNALNQLQNVAHQYLQASNPKSPPSASLERLRATTTTTNSPSTSDSYPSDQILAPGDINNGTLDSVHPGRHDQTSMKVPECKGRLKLNSTKGFITDGPGFYQTHYQCVWLIDSGRENSTIRLQLHQFNTECNYDYLYIFDGDSIFSPLIASLSGDMKDFSTAFTQMRLDNMISTNHNRYLSAPTTGNLSFYPVNSNSDSISSAKNNWTWTEFRTFEIKTHSGRAFIYFHSDTAQSMPGFYLTYTIDSCPLDCSNRGDCDYSTLTCDCNEGYYGEGCQHILCPNNCTSPQHGTCDMERSCICNLNFYGPDCSYKINQQTWISSNSPSHANKARAFHASVIVDDLMWIIGGRTSISSNTNRDNFRQKEAPLILMYDLKNRIWSDFEITGLTGIDHLAELSGHSIAATGHKVFIYGGIAMNNTILDALTVFDTKTRTLSSLSNKAKLKGSEEFVAPIPVVGHSANIVGSHMYVFFGYNPIHGFVDVVQRLNLADNTWSFVEKEGSSVSGGIGHSSSFDPASGLVYVYGGHRTNRLNSLYSFDPNSGVWILLQYGPSPRYYHAALIVNNQLLIIGGNSYNSSHQTDKCFQQTYLSYDLDCSRESNHSSRVNGNSNSSLTSTFSNCYMESCWQSIEGGEPNIMKRYGHSVLEYNHGELVLFGGFNGLLMDDVRFLNLTSCEVSLTEGDCTKSKLGLDCYWNSIDSKCETRNATTRSSRGAQTQDLRNCTRSELKTLQHLCEDRGTCSDCLSNNFGCVWCSSISQCQLGKCKSAQGKPINKLDLCFKEDPTKSSLFGFVTQSMQVKLLAGRAFEQELECRRLDNCYLCHSKPHCSWQNDRCAYVAPNLLAQPDSTSFSSNFGPDVANDELHPLNNSRALMPPNISQIITGFDPINRSFLAAFTPDLLNMPPYHLCDIPCFMRRSCGECTMTKCIWCSTTEQCVDSSAYFAYYPMGQCMHYVAHLFKCPISSCSEIETCDKCLTNPKCGWLNDISNSGKGKCIEGTSESSFDTKRLADFSGISKESTANASADLTSVSPSNWYYTSCPACQCNGHSYCKPNSNQCVQPCQDFTEGVNCERCISGYYGEPINGGTCKQCRCNGQAQTCNRETGKCYCSTKGVTGHNCNRCDDQHNYIGDPLSHDSGTCYYNLTTDFQYTFNMSKSEDHFYTDINFVNIPLRKESDVDFTIACSRLALINITSGSSFREKKPIHSNLECGSFRLRFSHDRLLSSDSNHSFFVQVFKFQTPFIIQITFSQHKTLYLQQFFFTFSSCFLFFFALSGLIWKLKLEYDSYIRRQRHFIEMEQMASRPFSSILLEVFKPSTNSTEKVTRPREPTPISFEPCFSNNVGVLSLFVQLPGKPNLAIGSALVTLNEDVVNGSNSSTDDSCVPVKRLDKDHTSASNQNL